MSKLLEVMNSLLGEDGCPWDRKQTHQSLRKYLIEESYEVVDAIDEGDMLELKKELGDLLFQIVFHSALAERQGVFSFADVAEGIAQKMITRHPWVFGDAETPVESERAWEEQKKAERENSPSFQQTSALDGVPRALPSLVRAQRVGEKAAALGFDWKDAQGALEKIKEEVAEVEERLRLRDKEGLEEELGDLLFACTSFARKNDIDGDLALTNAVTKFSDRFSTMERSVQKENRDFASLSEKEMDELWEAAKL